MTKSTLMLHVDATRVSLEDLEQVPQPEPMGTRHVPIHPAKWVKALQRAVEAYDFVVDSLALGANENRTRFFGTMDLTLGGETLGSGIVLGFRYSTDQTMANGLVGGERVFVCDNLALSGDLILLNRKSTAGFSPVRAFEQGLDKFQVVQQVFRRQIEAAKQWVLTPKEAEALLWQMFQGKFLPKKLMTPVETTFLAKAEGTGVTGRTLWDLHNAATYCLKGEDFVSQWARSTKLGTFLTQAVQK